jgi:exodeoxyribonuclease VII large subunit
MAGFAGRIAMKGRHAAELTHTLARVMREVVAGRERRLQQLRRQLEASDLGRRLAGIRTRLATAGGRLTGAMARRQHRAENQLRSCASRLETLSPLAVLGRGYSVCWNADRTRVLRDASETTTGERVRVTLAKGELDCEIRSTAEEPQGTRRTQS